MSSQRRSIPTADRISALPDEILCHILSFLPTKLAAATSVLSKRWKPVWLSVLALDFDDQTFEDFCRFKIFLYSAMRSRDIRLPIRSFSLKCGSSYFCNPRDVSLFVSDAVQPSIENLNIDISGNGKLPFPINFNLPPSILTFRALEVLKLKNLTVNYLSQVDFPRLKTLHLDSIDFRRHGCIVKLLSGCPILADLQTKSLGVLNWEKKRVPVPEENFKALPNLVKARVYNMYIPINLVCKAEILHLELLWTYSTDKLPMFHILTHMDLSFNKYCIWKWNCLLGVLENCPRLQNFTIQDCLDGIKSSIDNYWKDPPVVPECLSSQLKTCCLRGGYKDMECEFQFAKYIIQNSKVLKTMTIKSICSIDVNAKYQMLLKLSLCTRGSTTCKLLFD